MTAKVADAAQNIASTAQTDAAEVKDAARQGADEVRSAAEQARDELTQDDPTDTVNAVGIPASS